MNGDVGGGGPKAVTMLRQSIADLKEFAALSDSVDYLSLLGLPFDTNFT